MAASPSRHFLSTFQTSLFRETTSKSNLSRSICSSCLSKVTRARNNVAPRTRKRDFFSSRQNYQNSERTQTYRNPVDDPSFVSLIDQPVQLVRQKRRHGPGLIVLWLMPAIAFGLGTWQVFRLDWKTKLITRFEDRLVREPLPLPPNIDPSMIPSFDYRRIHARGYFRHDQEMLIGPRLHDGHDGYLVITPLERKNVRDAKTPLGEDEEGVGSTVLVNRGWIAKEFEEQGKRIVKAGEESLPRGEVTVEGLLREPWKKNMFTPVNKPEEGKFYFPDVEQMAKHVGAQPVWIEETLEPDLLVMLDREARGIPIGRAPEVNLRNNHIQYIFTWYALSAATAFMFYLVVKRPPKDLSRRVRQSRDWS